MDYDTLTEIMIFKEQKGYDKYFYGVFDINGTQTEIMLERNNDTKTPWKHKEQNTDQWEYCGREDIIRLVDRDNKANELFAGLYGSCMNELCMADIIIADLTKIFGADVIEKGRANNRKFADTLMQTIKKLTTKVVAGDGNKTEPKTGHLKLIRGE